MGQEDSVRVSRQGYASRQADKASIFEKLGQGVQKLSGMCLPCVVIAGVVHAPHRCPRGFQSGCFRCFRGDHVVSNCPTRSFPKGPCWTCGFPTNPETVFSHRKGMSPVCVRSLLVGITSLAFTHRLDGLLATFPEIASATSTFEEYFQWLFTKKADPFETNSVRVFLWILDNIANHQ